MKNYTSNLIAKGSNGSSSFQQLNLICLILFLTSATLFSQENMWEPAQPKGENPWATGETKEETPAQTESTTTSIVNGIVVNGEAVETSPQNDTVYFENGKVNLAVLNSKGSERHFYIDNQIVKLNTNNFNYYKSIKIEGKKAHNAYGALGAGMVTGTVISIFAIPVNLIASAVPTSKTNNLINKFGRENPHATNQEIKAFSKGVKERRFGQAMAGNVIGIVINAVALLVIGAL